MPEIEIIPVGDIDIKLRDFYNWNDSVKVVIDNLSTTLIEIKTGTRKNRKIFRFYSTNSNGEEIAINRCLLNGNHLLATAIHLEDDKFKPEKSSNELTLDQIQENIGVKIHYGKMKFLEQIDLTDKGSIVKRLWERYLKKLENRDKDYEELEKDYDERLENQRKSFQKTINEMHKTIQSLQSDIIAQLVVLSKKVTQTLSDSIIDNIIQNTLTSSDLREQLKKMKEDMQIKKENIDKLGDSDVKK